jgi:hypothetical protein
MNRFGLGKFCLISLAMLLLADLGFLLLQRAYRFLFGSPIPSLILYGLLIPSVLVCLLNFLYQHSYEGCGDLQRPTAYFPIKAKLEMFSFIGLFVAWVLLWHLCNSQWWSWGWVALYWIGQGRIRSVADKRIFERRLQEAKNWFPEMTADNQLRKARAWFESGLDPIEYELQSERQGSES